MSLLLQNELMDLSAGKKSGTAGRMMTMIEIKSLSVLVLNWRLAGCVKQLETTFKPVNKQVLFQLVISMLELSKKTALKNAESRFLVS